MIFLYRLLGYLLRPIAILYLKYRAKKDKEDPCRLHERHGYTHLHRPQGKLIWIHAASVGESLSALTLIEEIRKKMPSVSVLLTTGTVTSAALMKERLPEGVIHQYFSLDLTPWVKRFLNHWRPDLVLWLESELWPAHLAELRYRHIPSILLNARLSENSFRRWIRFPYYFRKITSLFNHIYTWSASDERKFHKLGVSIASFQGNLKTVIKPLQLYPKKREAFMKAIGKRPIWLAASTHRGEEEIIASAHHHIQKTYPHALCIIAPRHPDRTSDMMTLFQEQGFKVDKRTMVEYPSPEADIYIANTLGELEFFYQVAPISFVGGSFVSIGGHNIIEAVRASSAVIVGPYTFNFSDIVEDFVNHKSCFQITHPQELAPLVQSLIENASHVQSITARALKYLEQHTLLLDKIMATIDDYLKNEEGKN